MRDYQIVFAVLSAVILFLYGIENFGREVQRVAGDRLSKLLARMTANPLISFALGLAATGVFQSSTAVTVLTISLVSAGQLTFRGSLGIIIGSNVGTTFTAQLVALKLSGLGPVLIVLGFFLSLVRLQYSVFGKTIFFLGFIFFSLDMIGSQLRPLAERPEVIEVLRYSENRLLGFFAGMLITIVLQSSSVATGILVVALQSGLLQLDAAIPMMIGTNAGTTFTAWIASIGKDIESRRTAWAHIIFNLAGALLFLPLLGPFTALLKSSAGENPGMVLARGHLAFNLITATICLIALGPFERLLLRLIPPQAPTAGMP